jgi:hypothetical protein
MANLKQMNTWIEPNLIEEIERLAQVHGWSKAGAIRAAIRTLSEVMSKHEDAPRFADPDIRDLYLRIAREIPGQLVEVSRSVELLYVGDTPAVKAEGWLIWEDDATGELLAREQAGEQRFGRVINGKVEAMISPAIASQN